MEGEKKAGLSLDKRIQLYRRYYVYVYKKKKQRFYESPGLLVSYMGFFSQP